MRHGFDPRVAHRLLARFGVSASGREQAQEVRFARPVRAEYCDPITEKRVEIECTHQTRHLSSASQVTTRYPVRPLCSRI